VGRRAICAPSIERVAARRIDLGYEAGTVLYSKYCTVQYSHFDAQSDEGE
jgi:hypothetical protein